MWPTPTDSDSLVRRNKYCDGRTFPSKTVWPTRTEAQQSGTQTQVKNIKGGAFPASLCERPEPENYSLVYSHKSNSDGTFPVRLSELPHRSHRHRSCDNKTFPARLSDIPRPENISLVPQTQVLWQWNISCKTIWPTRTREHQHSPTDTRLVTMKHFLQDCLTY